MVIFPHQQIFKYIVASGFSCEIGYPGKYMKGFAKSSHISKNRERMLKTYEQTGTVKRSIV